VAAGEPGQGSAAARVRPQNTQPAAAGACRLGRGRLHGRKVSPGRSRAQTLLSKARDAYLGIGMPRYEALTSTLIAEAQ
jgi:hypothetical protein